MSAASQAGRGEASSAVYRRPLSADASRNKGPPSTESSPGPKYRTADYGRSSPEGRRADREQTGDEENHYPRSQSQYSYGAAPRGGESGDEISDIDARLNALQSFLQVPSPADSCAFQPPACLLRPEASGNLLAPKTPGAQCVLMRSMWFADGQGKGEGCRAR